MKSTTHKPLDVTVQGDITVSSTGGDIEGDSMITKNSIKFSSNPKKLTKWAKEEWGDSHDMVWMEYINSMIHPDDILTFSRLLFPDFVELKGSIFLKYKLNQTEVESWQKKLLNTRALEEFINHTHVYDLFSRGENIEEESYLQVAYLIARCWELSLSQCFKDKKFEVYVSNTDQDYGPTISFYQKD